MYLHRPDRVSNTSHLYKQSFTQSISGNVAVIFGLMILAIFIVVGAVIDLRTTTNREAAIQIVLDNSLLAAVREKVEWSEMPALARIHFLEEIKHYETQDLQYDLAFRVDEENMVMYGDLTGSIETTLLSLGGVSRMKLAVESAAHLENLRVPLCFMAMHPTRKHTLELKDAVHVYAPDCHIYGNSDHPYDVVDPHKPTTFLTGASVQAIGYGHHYLENVTPPLEYAPELIPDPLSGLAIPSAGCSGGHSKTASHRRSGKGGKKDKKRDGGGAATVISGGTRTLNPQNFCGGLEIKNGAKVTLQPGLYIIENGDFQVKNATLEGEDVTIVLGSGVVLEWDGARIELSAPRMSIPANNIRAGISLIGARDEETHYITDTFVDIHGVVYMLNGVFYWENDGSEVPSHPWTSWIVDGVTWTGNGMLHYNFDLSKGDVPFPSALSTVIPRPDSYTPRLLK